MTIPSQYAAAKDLSGAKTLWRQTSSISVIALLLQLQSVPLRATVMADSVRKTQPFNNACAINLTCSQIRSYDWTNGEKSSIDAKTSVRIASQHRSATMVFTADCRLQLGMSHEIDERTGERSYRCTDNALQAEAKVVMPCGWVIDPYILSGFRTTVTESFKQLSQGPQRTAKLWDPVTSEESCGFQLSRILSKGMVQLRTGASLQQVRSASHTAMSDDPRTVLIHERYKSQAGMECGLTATLALDSNIRYTGSYQSRKNIISSDAWQFRVENELRIKVWKSFGVCLEADLSYDETLSKRVQFKQSTQFGILLDY